MNEKKRNSSDVVLREKSLSEVGWIQFDFVIRTREGFDRAGPGQGTLAGATPHRTEPISGVASCEPPFPTSARRYRRGRSIDRHDSRSPHNLCILFPVYAHRPQWVFISIIYTLLDSFIFFPVARKHHLMGHRKNIQLRSISTGA